MLVFPWLKQNRTKCRFFPIVLATVTIGLSGAIAHALPLHLLEQNLRLVLHKDRQILELRDNTGKVKRFRVCLGVVPDGPKRITKDMRTPEGDYFICMKNRQSKYHLFMGLSYPGEQDARIGFEQGLISQGTRDRIIDCARRKQKPPWNTKLGGWVGIHGYPSDTYHHRWTSILFPKPHNWTEGCVALYNSEIEELFESVPVGTPITIKP